MTLYRPCWGMLACFSGILAGCQPLIPKGAVQADVQVPIQSPATTQQSGPQTMTGGEDGPRVQTGPVNVSGGVLVALGGILLAAKVTGDVLKGAYRAAEKRRTRRRMVRCTKTVQPPTGPPTA